MAITALYHFDERLGHIYDPPPEPAAINFKGSSYGSFYKLGVVFVGVLIIRALLCGVQIGAPDFWKLPYVNGNLGSPKKYIGAHGSQRGSNFQGELVYVNTASTHKGGISHALLRSRSTAEARNLEYDRPLIPKQKMEHQHNSPCIHIVTFFESTVHYT